MIKLTTIEKRELDNPIFVNLTKQTMSERLNKIIQRMIKDSLDCLVIYGDIEHGNNFEYLTGYLPRFEEALLVLHQNKESYLVMGNENMSKAAKAMIDNTSVHVPHFSLPFQPMEIDEPLAKRLQKTKIDQAKKIGIVGWKVFTSEFEDNSKLFDVPHYLIEAIKEATCAELVNATYLFVGQDGARLTNNANEIAHYAFGSELASNGILRALEVIGVGKTELEVADVMESYGQKHSMVTIMATGERFENANMYPSNKKIKLGDKISMTVGYKGGSQSVAGYVVHNETELEKKDYVEKVCIPYFKGISSWLESIHIGQTCSELYDLALKVLPKEEYNWTLNPGHLLADEEWLSSPIYKNSQTKIQSGMMFQVDIIPSVAGYGGINAECGFVICDEFLQKELDKEYPDLYQKMLERQKFVREVIGLNISKEILPTSNNFMCVRPYLLEQNLVLVNK